MQALCCDEVLVAVEDISQQIGATFGLKGEALQEARVAADPRVKAYCAR